MNPQWRSVALEILGYIDLVEFFMYAKLKSRISSCEPSKAILPSETVKKVIISGFQKNSHKNLPYLVNEIVWKIF